MKKNMMLFISMSVLIMIILTSCTDNIHTIGVNDNDGVNMKLSIAIHGGNLEAAKEAVNDGADKNNTSWSERTMLSNKDNNPVSMCIAHNNDSIAEYLLDNGADANYAKKYSLLMYAVSSGNYKISKKLIEKDADVNFTVKINNISLTPMCFLFSSDVTNNNNFAGNKKLFDLLYESGARIPNDTFNKIINNVNENSIFSDVPFGYDLELMQYAVSHINKEGDNGISDLMSNIILGNSDKAAQLLESNKLNDSDNKEALIIFASAFCNSNVIDKLLLQGCSLNTIGAEHENLLNIAAKYNTPETVEYLHKKGLNFTIHENVVNTTEYYSLLNTKDETWEYVLKNAPALKAENKEELLFTAAKLGNSNYLRMKKEEISKLTNDNKENLILNLNSVEAFKAVEEAGISDFTVALSQSAYLSKEVIQYIIDKGTDINSGHDYINSALYSAIKYGDLDKVKFLVESGAKINTKFGMEDGVADTTPLFTAISVGNRGIVQYLLDNGANLEDRNDTGQTPLIYSVEMQSYGITELLLDAGADKNSKDNDNMTAYNLAKSNYSTVKDQKMVDLFE